jgi:hypothetical protein
MKNQERLRMGDAVCLEAPVRVSTFVDAHDKTHIEVQSDPKGEQTISGAAVGVYCGQTYVTVKNYAFHSMRRYRGQSNAPSTVSIIKQAFRFGANTVFIDPSLVRVIARVSDTEKEE